MINKGNKQKIINKILADIRNSAYRAASLSVPVDNNTLYNDDDIVIRLLTQIKKGIDCISSGGGSTITVDDALSSTSKNPVQNKVIKTELDKKQPKGNYATTTQLNNKSDKIVKVDGGNGDITKEIEPNKFYVFGECTNLTITLTAEIAGIYNEYSFKFESGATATNLADIPNVKWIGDKTIKPNTTYIVAITSGLGVIGGA